MTISALMLGAGIILSGGATESTTPDAPLSWGASGVVASNDADPRSLVNVLRSWGAKEDWRVTWSVPVRYVLPSEPPQAGDFVTSASTLVRSLGDEGLRLTARSYKGNRILVISAAD